MFLKKIFELNKISENDYKTAQIITANIIKRDFAYVLAHPEKRYNIIERTRIKLALKKLKKNIPLAYILKQKEFYNLNFFVNIKVLIPRPETELLVDTALEALKNAKKGLFIDVGTGSGCIAISVGKNATGVKIFASDISGSALKVAKKNAGRHGVNVQFFKGDLLKALPRSLPNFLYSQIVIAANLPYLSREWHESEPSIAREPRSALVADNTTGLALYEKLFQQIRELKIVNCELIAEIDPRQSADAFKLAKHFFTNAKIQIKKDLAGNDRLVVIKAITNLKQ